MSAAKQVPHQLKKDKSMETTNTNATFTQQFTSDQHLFNIPESCMFLPFLSFCSDSLKGKRKNQKALSIIATAKTKSFIPNALKLYEKTIQLNLKATRFKSLNTNYRKRLLKMKRICQSVYLNYLIVTMTSHQRYFFRNQLRVPTKRRNRTYTIPNKIDAAVLWKSNPKMYKLLVNLFCLPPISTLRALLNKVPVAPGICEALFTNCKQRIQSFKDKDKLCVVLFAELTVQPHLTYDPVKDYIMGFENNGFKQTPEIADRVVVFVLRGVYKNWTQPVDFIFCKSPLYGANIARLYKRIVKKATEMGLHVVSSICNQESNNVVAVNLLLEETRANSIKVGEKYEDGVICVGKAKVVHLYDPWNLLKNLRDDFSVRDLNFYLNGKERVASWEHIVKAYDIDKSNNIGVIRNEEVDVTSEIFSRTVASAVKYCALSGIKSTDGASRLDQDAMDTAQLLEFIGQMFHSMTAGKVSRKSSQLRIWSSAVNVLRTMRFETNKPTDTKFPQYLKSWTQTIEGFVMLRSKLFDLGCGSFDVAVFNQDPLENLFGQIGNDTYLTCAKFIALFKLSLMKNYRRSFSKNWNYRDKDDLLSLKHFMRKK